MRVAGNKLRHLLEFYLRELADIYEPSEIRALFKTVVEHFLGWDASAQLRGLEENVNQSDLLKIYDTGKLLREGKPLQYLLKEAWFLNEKYLVNESVLIPRPETEELVDLILKEQPHVKSLLDIGTGSGCIPISLQLNCPAAQVMACDISEAAIHVAKHNNQKQKTNVDFIKADALSENFADAFGQTFQIIVSNPPYIKSSEAEGMENHVLSHEPHLALFVEGADAIIFYRRIIIACEKLLQSSGSLYFELNPLTAAEVLECAQESNLFSTCDLLKDMSGKWRFFRGIRG